MRTIRCSDVGFDCDGEIVAEDDAAVLVLAAAHARLAHGVEATPELVALVKAQTRAGSAPEGGA